MIEELTRYSVEQWIQTVATGEFHYKSVLNGDVRPVSHGKLRKIIFDIVHAEDPIAEPIGKRDGWYRPIDNGARPLDWQAVDARKDSGIILPFDLRKYVFLYPDTLTVVAGSKSSGKTGFLYRTVALNMLRANTILLSNLEGGVGQLRDRFYAMDIEIPKPAPFTLIPVDDHFHDYIKEKETVYVIDYIDAPEGTDFYMIGAAISKIDKKLKGLGSVAVVGIQKPATRDTGFGGDQTLRNASLYLAMDNSKLKIVDAKVPTDPTIHPKNMQWTFLYSDEGTNFINIQPYYNVGE